MYGKLVLVTTLLCVSFNIFATNSIDKFKQMECENLVEALVSNTEDFIPQTDNERKIKALLEDTKKYNIDEEEKKLIVKKMMEMEYLPEPRKLKAYFIYLNTLKPKQKEQGIADFAFLNTPSKSNSSLLKKFFRIYKQVRQRNNDKLQIETLRMIKKENPEFDYEAAKRVAKDNISKMDIFKDSLEKRNRELAELKWYHVRNFDYSFVKAKNEYDREVRRKILAQYEEQKGEIAELRYTNSRLDEERAYELAKSRVSKWDAFKSAVDARNKEIDELKWNQMRSSKFALLRYRSEYDRMVREEVLRIFEAEKQLSYHQYYNKAKNKIGPELRTYEELAFACRGSRTTAETEMAESKLKKFTFWIVTGSSFYAYSQHNHDKMEGYKEGQKLYHIDHPFWQNIPNMGKSVFDLASYNAAAAKFWWNNTSENATNMFAAKKAYEETKSNVDWVFWTKFGYEWAFQLGTSMWGIKNLAKAENSLAYKTAFKYTYARANGAVDAWAYDYLFGSDGLMTGSKGASERKEFVSQIMRDPERARKLQVLQKHLNNPTFYTQFKLAFDEDWKTLKESLGMDADPKLKDFDLTALDSEENYDKETVDELIFLASMAEIYEQTRGDEATFNLGPFKDLSIDMRSGNMGLDRWNFQAAYGLAFLPRDMAVALWIKHILCMGQNDPSKAYMMALSVFLTNRLVGDQLYYWSRDKAIRQ